MRKRYKPFGDETAEDAYSVARDAVQEEKFERAAELIAQARNDFPNSPIPVELYPFDESQTWDWDSFIYGAAKALWVDTYMTEVDGLLERIQAIEWEGEDPYIPIRQALSPGPGGNWMNFVPDHIPAAVKEDGKILTKLIQIDITSKALATAQAKIPDAEEAGFYAMMQTLGSGVGWNDYGAKLPQGIRMEASTETYNLVQMRIGDKVSDADYDWDLIQAAVTDL